MSIIMAADDERHGKARGYHAHRREGSPVCEPCRRAAAAAQARYEMLRARGVRSRLDPTGTQRRLRALVAMGYTWRSLDRRLGTDDMVEKWGNHTIAYVFPATAAKIAALYDELCMTLPVAETAREKAAATKARNLARSKGWAPPLAYDNIDDPAENPTGWQYVSGDRHADLDDLLDRGVGVSEAARVLGCTVKALEKWMDRHGRRADYNRLTMRERGAA